MKRASGMGARPLTDVAPLVGRAVTGHARNRGEFGSSIFWTSGPLDVLMFWVLMFSGIRSPGAGTAYVTRPAHIAAHAMRPITRRIVFVRVTDDPLANLGSPNARNPCSTRPGSGVPSEDDLPVRTLSR